MLCVLVSDPTEVPVHWSKFVVNIQAEDKETWIIRAFKQYLGEIYTQGGHIEIDDITVHLSLALPNFKLIFLAFIFPFFGPLCNNLF